MREQAPADRSACLHGPWRYAGSVDEAKRGSMCERPYALVCMACGLMVTRDCETTRSAQCQPCGRIYRGRVQRIARAFSGLLMVTLTAPGTRLHRVKAVDGGWVVCPCTKPGGVDIAVWNAGAAMAWSRLVNNGIRRDPALAWLAGAYFRATEVQGRGALHFHVLVKIRPGTVVPANGLRDLRALAIAYGFGHEADVQEVEPGRGAYYVAKYVGKASNLRAAVPWSKRKAMTLTELPLPVPAYAVRNEWVQFGPVRPPVVVEYMSRQATYRTWSCSRDWPSSMGALRRAQQHYAHLLASLPSWQGRPDGLPALVVACIDLRDRPDILLW